MTPYLIIWPGGASGAFLSMCIYNLIVGDTEIVLSINGNAHKNEQMRFASYPEDFPFNNNEIPIYVGHQLPDYAELFDKLPDCKIIYISVDSNMLPRLVGNMFFKNICEFDYLTDENIVWENLKKVHSYFIPYKLPTDVPYNIVKQFILDASESYILSSYAKHGYVPPIEFQNQVYFINFYDIIHNIRKVLKQLSFITGKPITPFLIKQANNYLAKQEELVKTKMPWLDDKYHNE